MSNYNSIKATIDANIKTNDNQEITGHILNSVLNEMVSALGEGYQFMGVVTPASAAISTDGRVFVFAFSQGTYSNFGNLQVSGNGMAILYYDTSWHKAEFDIFTRVGDMITERLTAFEESLAAWAFKGDPPAPPALDNPVYEDVAFFPQSTSLAYLRLGGGSSQTKYMVSPLIKLGEIGDNVSLSFSVGEVASGTSPGIIYFKANGDFGSYHSANANPRTVTLTLAAETQYCRLFFQAAKLSSSYIYDNTTGVYLFQGSQVSQSEIQGWEYFYDSDYMLAGWKVNSRGDFIGWNFNANANLPSLSDLDDYYRAKARCIGSAGTQFPYSISKRVAFPANQTISVTFSVGEANSSFALRLINENSKTANHYAANANPRTVTIDTNTYTHFELFFPTGNYASAYVKDNTNNVMLWEGANV